MQTDRTLVRLIAADSQLYEGRQLRPGDKFEARQSDVLELIALGLARRDDADEKQKDAPEPSAPAADAEQQQAVEPIGRTTLRLKREVSRNRFLRRDARSSGEAE